MSERAPPEGTVRITPDELGERLLLDGRVLTMTVDGETFRVLDPWERGEVIEPERS